MGCEWVGELEGLKSHLTSDKGCGYVVVTCTNRGCGERLRCKDLQTHLQVCCYRLYKCEHCGYEDTYTAITGSATKTYWRYKDHHSKCPEYPLACPNRCGVTGIRRRAMPDHRSSCPLEPLDCPFKDAGCTEKIERKDMKHHMSETQHKHMLLIFQSLQQSKQELEQSKQEFQKQIARDRHELYLLKSDISREIDQLEDSIRHKTNTPKSTADSLSHIKSFLRVSLNKTGEMATFQVSGFHQLRKKNKTWQSPPFSIADKVKVQIVVYPSGFGKGYGSHVSVSLMLTEVVKRGQHTILQYNVVVAAVRPQKLAISKVFELCTYRKGDNEPGWLKRSPCSANSYFPPPGMMLHVEELFMEIKNASSALVNDSMTLELTLLEHCCHKP